ncbi:MAG: hypothetical protein WCA23_18440 [Stellaceae bacterium]
MLFFAAIYQPATSGPRGIPRQSIVRRSEKQREDLIFWLFFAVFAAQNSHREVSLPARPSRQVREPHDIAISNICQFHTKVLVSRWRSSCVSHHQN